MYNVCVCVCMSFQRLPVCLITLFSLHIQSKYEVNIDAVNVSSTFIPL